MQYKGEGDRGNPQPMAKLGEEELLRYKRVRIVLVYRKMYKCLPMRTDTRLLPPNDGITERELQRAATDFLTPDGRGSSQFTSISNTDLEKDRRRGAVPLMVWRVRRQR